MKVAVVGATGAVGREMLRVLEEQDELPVSVSAFSSRGSGPGEELVFRGEKIELRKLVPGCLEGFDYALFAVDEKVSLGLAEDALARGVTVIDNSAAFRMREGVPLVVPEVNGDALSDERLIANPNCSTIQLVLVLAPLARHPGIEKALVATYQSVSGTGLKAQQELLSQVERFSGNERPVPVVYPHPIAFNCFPHVGSFDDGGMCTEEGKIVEESGKILARGRFRVSATTVRIPTLRCHAQAVYVETGRKTSPDEIRKILSGSPGVKVLDRPEMGLYPTPLEVSGSDFVWVGRVRRAFPGDDRCFWLWTVSDNLRKGAALNAVQIMKLALSRRVK